MLCAVTLPGASFTAFSKQSWAAARLWCWSCVIPSESAGSAGEGEEGREGVFPCAKQYGAAREMQSRNRASIAVSEERRATARVDVDSFAIRICNLRRSGDQNGSLNRSVLHQQASTYFRSIPLARSKLTFRTIPSPSLT